MLPRHLRLPISAGMRPFKRLLSKTIVHAAFAQFLLHDQVTLPPSLVENVTVSTPILTKVGQDANVRAYVRTYVWMYACMHRYGVYSYSTYSYGPYSDGPI